MAKLTRIAPTPSGYLHAGNAVSFLLTAAIAKKAGAKLLLRIDDLDAPRVEQVFIEDIFIQLEWLGIEIDGGPSTVAEVASYSQQLKVDLYLEALTALAERQTIYACRCSRKQWQQAGHRHYPGTCRSLGLPFDDVHAWRFNTVNAHSQLNEISDTQVDLSLEQVMGDFVVRRRDGLPAYQVASLFDDEQAGVNLVVRGIDLLPSSLAQAALSRSLGYSFHEAGFCHHLLIAAKDGSKLSKSRADSPLKEMREFDNDPAWLFELAGLQLGQTGVNNFDELLSHLDLSNLRWHRGLKNLDPA